MNKVTKETNTPKLIPHGKINIEEPLKPLDPEEWIQRLKERKQGE